MKYIVCFISIVSLKLSGCKKNILPINSKVIVMDLPTFSSIGPEIWGRSFWEFLDAIIATYPRENPSAEQHAAVRDLLQSLRYVLPCPTCRKHYNDFIQTHSLDQALSSRRSLLDFYFTLKKDIAVRTGKGFVFSSPDDLWLNITRRLRLVPNVPAQMTRASPTPTRATVQQSRLPMMQKPAPPGKTVFRVPARMNNAAAKAIVKKGCGCGKK